MPPFKLLVFLIFISFNSFAYKFDKYFAQLNGCAAATGYQIVGGSSRTHLMKDFVKNGDCEKYDKFVKKASKELDIEIAKLDKMLKEPSNPLCSELLNMKKEFLVKRPLLENQSDADLAVELKYLKNKYARLPIQDVHNLLAYKGTMCAANSAIRELSIHHELGEQLKKIKYLGAPLSPSKNGDVVESCRNVKATGGGNLKNFFIKVNKLNSYKFKVTYNHFQVPDKILVMYGSKVLFGSGCIGTTKELTDTFDFSKNDTQIEVRIIGDCSVPEDQRNYAANAWEFQLQCDEKIEGGTAPEIYKACDEDIDKYHEQANVIESKYDKVVDTYWAKARCYQDAHKRLFNDYVYDSEKTYFPAYFTSDQKLLNAFLAEMALFEKRKLEISKPIKTSPVKVAKSLPVQPKKLLPNYKEFFLGRSKYCGRRPKKNASLFKTISFSYCFYGYIRLFDEGHPIYD